MSYFNIQDLDNVYKNFGLRLKLDGLIIGAEKYEFNYNSPNSLPQKNSMGYDHWGYYNAESNLKTQSHWDPNMNKWVYEPYILPELMVMDYSHFDEDILFEGANRETNPEVVTNGILESIQYPTGGLVEFEYEPNEFKLSLSELNSSYGLLKREDKYEDVSYHVITYAASSSSCTGCGYINNPTEQIIITQPTTINVEFEYHPYGSIQNPPVPLDGSGNGAAFGVVARIDGGGTYNKTYRFIPGETAHTYTEEIQLDPGTYIISAVSTAEYFTVSGKAMVTIDNGLSPTKEMLGGGVRIKKIISEKNTREFLYHKYDNDQETSGLLLVEPYYSFFNYGMFPCSVAFMRNSNAVFPLSENSSGATVGYTWVQEVITDGSDSSIHVSKFKNFRQGQVRGSNLPVILNYENGLISEELFQSNDRIISKNVYEYEDLLGIPYQYPETYFLRINFTVHNNYYSLNYYRVDPKWYGLASKSTFDYFYDSEGNPETVSTSTSYQYNVENHQVKQVNTINSHGDELMTKTFYPVDITSISSLIGGDLTTSEFDAIDRLKAVKDNEDNGLHRTAVPIQIETYKNALPLSILRTTYKYLGNDQVYPDRILSSKGGITLDPRITYLDYDEYGNPLEVSKVDGAHIYYVWGYNGQYPIAKIEKSTLTENNTGQEALIFLARTAADNDTDLVSENFLRNALNNLRNGFPDALVTTYTYDPLVGVTSITDPKGNTVYYIYDGFNRLKEVRDAEGNLVTDYEYHYKNE